MKTYDLYGYISDNRIGIAREAVEAALGRSLKLHESSHHCGDYFRLGDLGSEHFILQRNYDEHEKEWTEKLHSKFPLLLYVNETIDAESWERKLTSVGFSLLRREKL